MYQTLDDMIKDAGWFHGSDREWRALSLDEQSKLSFAATGCLIAYATWHAPVHCLHTQCQIARGELPQIALTNRILRAEYHGGWLRWNTSPAERSHVARLFVNVRNAARKCGVYDPWLIPGGWQSIICVGVLA